MAIQPNAGLHLHPQLQLSFLQTETPLGLPKGGDALPTQHQGPDPSSEPVVNPALSLSPHTLPG